MTAAEVIEKIKALPPEELEVVRRFLLNGAAESEGQQPVRYATDEQFDAAMDRVFENHEELLRKLAE